MAVIRQTADSDNDPDKVGTRYTVRNPHPGFGVDPNIKNEYGHSHYPKWVDHPTEKEVHYTTTYLGKDQSRTNRIVCDGEEGRPDIPVKVLVQNEQEEKALLDGREEMPKTKQAKGWTK